MTRSEIYLRAHITQPTAKVTKVGRLPSFPIWPEKILVFDAETTVDTRQELTFGVYRLCELRGGKYVCTEEGLFHSDDLDDRQLKVLKKYVQTQSAQVEAKSFPPRMNIKLFPRWEFLEKVFWKAIREDRLIVAFNLPFDLSRLAVDWAEADNGGWSLILSRRPSNKTGLIEPNPYRPRVRVTAKDSKSAFIALTKTLEQNEWPRFSRFLDVRSLAFALFGKSFSLEGLCRSVNVPGKLKHEPTGKVTSDEIDYCRGDVRSTIAALNALKIEFDRYALDLSPDQAYSPASMAKAHLWKMGLVPPKDKFDVSDRINGIAMQGYFGGRAECRIRHTSVPVVHTDFKSQYPTVNTLLGNWGVLTAESVSFNPATDQIRKLMEGVTLNKTFQRDFWKKLNFFALVRPDRDIFPVRASYNGQTQNIGVNELSAETPIWVAGPDLVASILLAGKVPRIIEAIRMVPHGMQKGLKPISLYGTIDIDPSQHDFFQHVIEKREMNHSNPDPSGFLKVLANSGSYGLFVEVSPEATKKPTTVKVSSGETSFEAEGSTVEDHGDWYFPPVASLITAGGRLLLAMVEKCVAEFGGTYLFCDTDSMCIVANELGGLVDCEGPEGARQIHALSWKEVESICHRFRHLNPYDSSIVSDILKIEKINFNPGGGQRQLFGFAVSAKRYALFERNGDELTIVDPKAHGLGYLYPPKERLKGEPDWTHEAWEWLLRDVFKLPNSDPSWLERPAMMSVARSTPEVLKRLNKLSRPFNFMLIPLIDKVAGYPADVDRNQFTLVTPFNKDRDSWMSADYMNIYDGKHCSLSLEQTPQLDRVIPKTFGYILRSYLMRPEHKSSAPDGSACKSNTRGVLQRKHIVATQRHFIGKETNRKWEQGEDISLIEFKPLQFNDPDQTAIVDRMFIEQILAVGIKPIARRTKLDRNTVRKVVQGLPVRPSTSRLIRDALMLLPQDGPR